MGITRNQSHFIGLSSHIIDGMWSLWNPFHIAGTIGMNVLGNKAEVVSYSNHLITSCDSFICLDFW